MSNHDDTYAARVPSLKRFAQSWTRASEHARNSLVEANRATLAAFGLSSDGSRLNGTSSVTYSDPDWSVERSIAIDGTVSVGDVVTFAKSIDEEDVERFAIASGDTNRLHLDEEFAEGSRFGGPIAHGTLVSGLISAALARLPGLTIYLSQDVTFLKPVETGDELNAVCEVVEDLGDRTFRLTTCVFNRRDEKVIDGEAIVLIDEIPVDTE